MARRLPRGLTLIEIAITLAVLAILATIALPAFGDRLARQRLVATAEGLAMDLADARFQAAQTGQSLHLVFAPGADWCYAVARAPGCDCRSMQACQLKVVRARDVPGILLAHGTDASFDASAVAAVGGAAELRSARGPHALRVSLTPLGRARLCSPSGLAGYPPC